MIQEISNKTFQTKQRFEALERRMWVNSSYEQPKSKNELHYPLEWSRQDKIFITFCFLSGFFTGIATILSLTI